MYAQRYAFFPTSPSNTDGTRRRLTAAIQYIVRPIGTSKDFGLPKIRGK